MEYDSSMTLNENILVLEQNPNAEYLNPGGNKTMPSDTSNIAVYNPVTKRKEQKAISKTDVGYSKAVAVPSFWSDPHQMTMILSIAALVIPVAGPFISAGIMIGDAALYHSEGNEKDAGLSLLFAFLPGMGKVVSKIPALEKLGVKGMTQLFSKLKNGSKVVTPLEKEALEGIKANEQLIKTEYEQTLKQKAKDVLKTTTKATEKSKLQKFVTGTGKKITSTAVRYGKGVVKFGWTFAQIAALIKVYDKVYDSVRGETPRNIVDKLIKSNLDPRVNAWEFAKKTFGSTGSKDDNLLMVNAIKSGWKPGNPVPPKFQTQKYKTEVMPSTSKEQSDYEKLLADARQEAGV